MEHHIDSFKREYQSFLAQSIVLPCAIMDSYTVCDCFHETQDKATYLIRSKATARPAILKVAAKNCKENVEAEYHLLKSLSHKSLPYAIDYFEHDECHYLIREYMEGLTLMQLVEEKGPRSKSETLRIALELCDVLHYLHSQTPPVIHRDIKPQNIILSPQGECSLIDFGIARRYHIDAPKDTVFMGTEATAAPEQFGYMQTDVRSDIYSLGVLMLYLAADTFDVLHCREYIADKKLAKIISKCTSFSPDNRYATVKQLKMQLMQLTPKKHKFSIAIVACAFAAGLFIGFLLPSAILPPKAKSDQFAMAPSSTVEPTLSPSPLPAATEVPLADTAVFSSPLIEKAVRAELGKSNDEPISQADLDSITKLLICGDAVFSGWDQHFSVGKVHFLNNQEQSSQGTIDSLTDIAKMKNIRQLALYNQQIKDLTPLAGLNLVNLGIGGNKISDISVLTQCGKLEQLNLSNNPISSIEPLSSLATLRVLDVSDTNILGIEPLSGIGIESLSMLDTYVQDYSQLSTLPLLQGLRVRNATKQQISAIASLTTLKNLTIYSSHFDDLSLLKNLSKLEQLDLWDNDLASLQGIERFPLLNNLCIGNNPLTDLSPLQKLKHLGYLNIKFLSAKSYAPLGKIESLEQVECTLEQKNAIEEIQKSAGFTLRVTK